MGTWGTIVASLSRAAEAGCASAARQTAALLLIEDVTTGTGSGLPASATVVVVVGVSRLPLKLGRARLAGDNDALGTVAEGRSTRLMDRAGVAGGRWSRM